MQIHSIVRASLLAIATVIAIAACGQDGRLALSTAPSPGGTAPITATSNLLTIPLDANNFVSGVTNPYFPLPPGKVFTYQNLLKDTQEHNTVEVTKNKKTILGVAVTVVHDQVFLEDGSLGEDTFDWYAQDQQGNVWSFGEDTRTYDHGTLITTAGSWQAGQNGARAGIAMLANPFYASGFGNVLEVATRQGGERDELVEVR